MAWYLSEVVTDLFPLADILKLHHQFESSLEGNKIDDFKKHLVPFLRQSNINTDHIDTDTIPVAYENDEYKWLAAGYFELLNKMGLLVLTWERGFDGYPYTVSNTGRQFLQQDISLAKLLKTKLTDWHNDKNVRPYPILLDILSKLKRRNLYPCGGLLLLEVLIVLLQLNKLERRIDFYDYISEKRREFYPHMAGEVSIDLINYSGFLWEQLSQDPTNFHAANYPARSTLQLMLYAGELAYGPVPDEIFGLVQYVTIA